MVSQNTPLLSNHALDDCLVLMTRFRPRGYRPVLPPGGAVARGSRGGLCARMAAMGAWHDLTAVAHSSVTPPSATKGWRPSIWRLRLTGMPCCGPSQRQRL